MVLAVSYVCVYLRVGGGGWDSGILWLVFSRKEEFGNC